MCHDFFDRLRRAAKLPAFLFRAAAENRLVVCGEFETEVRERGKLVPFGRRRFRNGTTTAGLNHLLSVGLVAGTQVTAWYLAPIDDNGYSGISTGDTAASHAGWTEIQTQYDETTRQLWSGSAPSGGSTNNYASPATFTFNGTKTVKGMAMLSVSTKGSTGGTLFSTGVYGSGNEQAMITGQTLSVRYKNTLVAG